jgi:FKBP-type peptidyl-prolyl cis-trans isomerase
MTLRWLGVLGALFLATGVCAAETPDLKTPLERQSYGLGVDMGKSLKRQGAEMDPDIVLRGLRDAMKGDQLLMSDEELMSTKKSFAAERRVKQLKGTPAAQEDGFKVEDMETLYALGLVLNRQLSVFNLTPSEFQLVKQGFSDAGSGVAPAGDLDAYSKKINELAQSRRKAQGEKLAALNQDFLGKAAREKGALKSDSGLVYLSLKEGSGTGPGPADTVKVRYRGTLPDGKEFSSSFKKGEPIELKVDGAIKCWNEGLQRMKTGGKAKLVCPPETAYGETGAGDLIMPYATLVFEVELLEVKR